MDKFIHYGSDTFYPQFFRPIKNCNFCKPVGGLWASPLNTEFGWKDWCIDNEFNLEALEQHFIFSLNKKAKIYIIDHPKRLFELPTCTYSDYVKFLDFECIAEAYDAIWLTKEGEVKTAFTFPISLYGWDCESILVLKPNNIKILK